MVFGGLNSFGVHEDVVGLCRVFNIWKDSVFLDVVVFSGELIFLWQSAIVIVDGPGAYLLSLHKIITKLTQQKGYHMIFRRREKEVNQIFFGGEVK